MPKQSIVVTRFGDDVTAWMVFEIVIVALPVTIETKCPLADGGKTDDVALLRFMQKVGDNDNIVRWPALVPAVEGDNFALVMQVIHLCALAAEAARNAASESGRGTNAQCHETPRFDPNRRAPYRGTNHLRETPAPETASVCRVR